MELYYSQNVQLIYFPYGLVFFIMGYTIAFQVRNFSNLSNLEIVKHLWLLAGFGLVHGLAEFSIIFLPIHTEYLSDSFLEWLKILQLLVIGVSYLFLFHFGISLIDIQNKILKNSPNIIFAMWLGYLVFLRFKPSVDAVWLMENSEMWIRYLLGFPASLLSGFGLTLQWRKIKNITNQQVSINFLAAALVFFFYAFVAGLVVAPTNVFPATVLNTKTFVSLVRIPVELLRTMSGMAMAYFVISGLEVFRVENSRQIEEAKKLKSLYEERGRISRDLHDGIIQSIYMAGLSLENISYLIQENQQEAKKQVYGVMQQLNTVIKDIRNYIVNLNSENFNEANLEQGIKKLLTTYQASYNFSKTIDVKGRQEIILNEEECSNFYHIVNEVLTNTIKHSQASHVKVYLEFTRESIFLSIKDNGRGFEVPYKHFLSQTQGQGLKNMYARAKLLSGHLKIISNKGKGTETTLYLEKGGEESESENSFSVG